MSDRLDRIEAGLDETRKIVESNSRAIEAWANQSAEWANESAEYKRQTTVAIGRLTSISEQLPIHASTAQFYYIRSTNPRIYLP
jgi:hypothetical protein